MKKFLSIAFTIILFINLIACESSAPDSNLGKEDNHSEKMTSDSSNDAHNNNTDSISTTKSENGEAEHKISFEDAYSEDEAPLVMDGLMKNKFMLKYDEIMRTNGEGYDVNEYIDKAKELWTTVEDGLVVSEKQVAYDFFEASCYMQAYKDEEIQDMGQKLELYLRTTFGSDQVDLEKTAKEINKFFKN